MSIGDLIKDSVDDLVRELPPKTGLADAAMRQARRRRFARIAMAGAAALAVAGAAALVIFDPFAGSDGVGPANGGGDSVVIELDRLPVGPPPDVPWFADGVIHLGETEITFDYPVVQMGEINPVAGGAVIQTRPGFSGPDGNVHDGYALHLVDREGNIEQLAEGFIAGPAVSADGGLIAWADEEWDPDADSAHPARTTLYVADAESGDLLHVEREGDTGDHFGKVIGFLDNQRVLVQGLDRDHNRADGLFLWNLETGTVAEWAGYRSAGPLAQSGGVGVFSRPTDERIVLDTVTGHELWAESDGYLLGNAFAPDGQYAARRSHHGDRLAISIVDAGTGRELVRYDMEMIEEQPMAWESDGSLLFEARNGTDTALVRCNGSGDCELATEPRATETFPEHGIRSPYFVGSTY
jgi:hypothetical protein